MMTLNDVEKLFIPDNFGPWEWDSWSDVIDDVVSQCTGYDPDIQTSSGASKFVILLDDDTVIKVPFAGYYFTDCDGNTAFDKLSKDYCYEESCIYTEAKELGLEMFLAKTEHFTSNLYISDRVIPYDDFRHEDIYVSEESRKKAYSPRNDCCDISRIWLEYAYEYYPEDKVNAFVDFIFKKGINDIGLHNVGFRKNGAPVIYDYSGYDEC